MRAATPSTTSVGHPIHVGVVGSSPLLGFAHIHVHTRNILNRQSFILAVTAAVASIMVEAREASNTFSSSMPHVGTFSLDGSSAELKIICDGVRMRMTQLASIMEFSIMSSLSFHLYRMQ